MIEDGIVMPSALAVFRFTNQLERIRHLDRKIGGPCRLRGRIDSPIPRIAASHYPSSRVVVPRHK